MKKYGEVALNLPVNKVFHYSLPEEWQKEVCIGKRVLVPLGNRKEVGVLVGIVKKPKVREVRSILKVIDEFPVFNKELLDLTKWIAKYYMCSWGEALATASPPHFLSQITKESREISQIPSRLSKFNRIKGKDNYNLILQSVQAGKHTVILLQKLSAVEKIKVYLYATREVVKRKKGVIILVPEISLINTIKERFKSYFGETVSVFHSRLSAKERYSEWERIKEGKVDIVIGTRSALFSPFSNLGLVIVDREEDFSYKQEETPRYWTRDVVIKRAENAGAVVLLESLAPSLESYYKGSLEKYELVSNFSKEKEVFNKPSVKVVDMREEWKKRGKEIVLSQLLQESISGKLNKKEQIILFLNKRGFANFLLCWDCGEVFSCPNCQVPLTYYLKERIMQCHYCNYEREAPDSCPRCQGYHIRYLGVGTQKVEREIRRLFPQARVFRVDSDTINKKDLREKIFASFQQGEIDILIGTQMILKGVDFRKTTLIGVISADIAFNFPDFRAGEHTFQLLTQIVNKELKKNLSREVIIQTYNPTHHTILAIQKHSEQDFYRKEILYRKQLNYPPFTHLIRIVIRGEKEIKVKKAALELGKRLNQFEILGPSPCPLTKLRGKYRWHLVIKTKKIELLPCLLKFRKDMNITIDVDPLAML